MAFPISRPRRLRTTETMRRLVAENELSVNDLVYPLFTCPGNNVKEPIPSMDGCFHISPDIIAEEAMEVASLEIPAVLIFGLPSSKDATGSEAADANGPVPKAIKAIKKACPDLLVITDVCLCAYTDHGHCGVVKDGKIENDISCGLLAEMALTHALAGADIVAPSDMMDGRIGVMRQKLDEEGLVDIAIMSYSAKYASAFYGPFRDAAHSAPGEGDRKSYQMDPPNSDEAMVEMELDLQEGADMLMVKPGLPYLDIIYRARQKFNVPIAAYNVSGEYMCINAAASAGLIDRQAAMMESLTSLKRAGAGIIITYYAKEAAKLLSK
ncbi:MAG: porphobilinogen synthase [Phycisphaerae bacterium]|nr:porphobilinogen synthase [Phycisphaerae bacterium]